MEEFKQILKPQTSVECSCFSSASNVSPCMLNRTQKVNWNYWGDILHILRTWADKWRLVSTYHCCSPCKKWHIAKDYQHYDIRQSYYMHRRQSITTQFLDIVCWCWSISPSSTIIEQGELFVFGTYWYLLHRRLCIFTDIELCWLLSTPNLVYMCRFISLIIIHFQLVFCVFVFVF